MAIVGLHDLICIANGILRYLKRDTGLKISKLAFDECGV